MKFGLLGKDIQHSKSPAIYEKILGNALDYDLIDIKNRSQLPTIEELKKIYRGINITSPYKTHYLNDVFFETPDEYKDAINVMRFHEDKVFATNTDATAIELEIDGLKRSFKHLYFLILGDGSMSKLTSSILKRRGFHFEVFSRKMTPGFSNLNLSSYADRDVQIVVINTCSRDYVFNGVLHSSYIFWDYNYSFIPHQSTLPKLVKHYHDGQRMLELQAIAAAKFWKII